MPITLAQIKNELYPGLAAIEARYRLVSGRFAPLQGWTPAPAAPHIWIPKLTLPQAALAATAAAIITNPPVTRRFWKGWLA